MRHGLALKAIACAFTGNDAARYDIVFIICLTNRHTFAEITEEAFNIAANSTC